ncbi:MAG TPA: PAS domain S-box protein [Bacteroidales bacterium]|nr:PAS domain S-box protein [Bacteroidales bacterium]
MKKISNTPNANSTAPAFLSKNTTEIDLKGLSTAFDLSGNSIIITDIEGTILYVNQRFCELTEYSKAEVIGKNPRIIKYEKSEIDYRILWETILNGETWRGEFVNRSKSGRLFWEIGTITPLKNQEGKITHFLAIKEDITYRKIAEENLLRAKNYYLSILEDYPVMVWICNPAGEFSFFNKTLLAFTGWDNKQGYQSSILNWSIHPDDFQKFEKALNMGLKSHKLFSVEFRMKHRSGIYYWVLVHGKPFTDFEGKFEGVIGSIIDIHDRKSAQQKLLKNEKDYRRMFEDSSLGIFRLNRQFLITRSNLAFARFFGFNNPEEVVLSLNNSPESFFPNLAQRKNLFRQILNEKKSRFSFNEVFYNQNGETRHARIYLRKVKNTDNPNDFHLEGFLEDDTSRKMAEQKLKNSEIKFKTLFEKSFDAILILDGITIIDSNKKLRTLLGKHSNKLPEKTIDLLCTKVQYHGENTKRYLKDRIAEAAKGKSLVFQLLMQRGKEVFDAEVSLTRIELHHKMLLQAVIRDISQRLRAEQELRQTRDMAEKARKAQAEFLSMMSHEIRTPLNAVVSLTDLMLNENPNPTILENLQPVNVSAKHLLGLIDDILDYNKIESGNILFEARDFDIRIMIRQACNTFEQRIREKNLSFYYDVNTNVPKYLKSDTLRLKQILLNLLSNAVKFTEKGHIRLLVDCISETNESHQIRFCVEDTGIGIRKERLDQIFDRFTQADLSTTRRFGGSGLGLSISKRLVELQGGKINVESNYGQGSTFCFMLPMQTGNIENLTKLPNNESASFDTLEGLKILMVEDDKVNQFVGKQIIQNKGKAFLEIASDGEEALLLLKTKKYDLILMDLLLPGMDGYELTRVIRENPEGDILYSKIPIIVLTADAFMETRSKAFEAGVNDFITKPVDFVKLLKTINRVYNETGRR